ncbi:MAG: ferritin-like domain-containing protein [Desulfobacteraceae bacterium]|nr:MAG: ferritin-like domain-containing protein [Desulfobacteraceae bacterium]
MQLDNLKQLYVHELQDLYSAENQITDALPKMADATKDERLRSAFLKHLEVTKHQKRRLEEIFDQLGEKPASSSCEGMQGIIKEGESFIKKEKSFFRGDIDSDVLDAALIASAQRVEHYEMSGYGTARTYAERLGYPEQASLLQQTLDEEVSTDRELTQLAESSINIKAQK